MNKKRYVFMIICTFFIIGACWRYQVVNNLNESYIVKSENINLGQSFNTDIFKFSINSFEKKQVIDNNGNKEIHYLFDIEATNNTQTEQTIFTGLHILAPLKGVNKTNGMFNENTKKTIVSWEKLQNHKGIVTMKMRESWGVALNTPAKLVYLGEKDGKKIKYILDLPNN
ncbi:MULTISPECIES: hypothetical protein [Bacillus]|uniref:DUF4352 domain-containing protein n=1 Tax=Bacillus wiedmannii TaxID=1890302 RepID=A0A2B5XPD6_9BACI|nr:MULTISPECIES: hypothetical protein [Bacillus]OUB82025.1 hypothetical protein BK788_23850 [Bacillus thuringiensis serovar sinensis]MBY7110102.1 hypothetical protein [Bacillus sp. 17RED48]MCR6848704.1 hypothetical protein [Bacillus sp. IBL03825]MCU5110263.1 hypothetical protein [Bacillus wiedmannii]MCU5149937.1 hypothetical protein [Bacillus wiedmannii]